MKLKKLMDNAETWFDSRQKNNKKRKKCVKKVLKKLRKYQKKLEQKIEQKIQEESDAKVITSLQKKMALTQAQREKGLQVLRDLKRKK